MTVTASRPPKVAGSAKYVLRKLPLVTALFWALKIVAVTLGETGSDEFAIELKFGYVACAIVFFAFFVIIVGVQLRAKRFYPGIFWTVIFSTSIVGTAISDLMDRGVGHSGTVTRNGIGYGAGAVILTSLLAIIFLVWWRTGQTYDVEKIATRKGEVLYWAAILVSNTLGTASGDWLSHGTGLGFRNAFFAIAGVMLLLLAAHYLTSINTMVLFWLAFILTRPLSAAAGDSITKPVSEGDSDWARCGVRWCWWACWLHWLPIRRGTSAVTRSTCCRLRPTGSLGNHSSPTGWWSWPTARIPTRSSKLKGGTSLMLLRRTAPIQRRVRGGGRRGGRRGRCPRRGRCRGGR
ncbi:hypothetical protein ACFQ0Q_46610 [Streptomyces aureus]